MKPVRYAWDDAPPKRRPVWKMTWFWFVLLPSALIAICFALAVLIGVSG